MKHLPSACATPTVPHYLLPERPIDAALMAHFDRMIEAQQGFLVFDFTGALIKQLCQRIPRIRARETVLLGYSGTDRVLGTNPLIPFDHLTCEDHSWDLPQMLGTLARKRLTASEQRLLQLSCQTLLHAGAMSRDPGYMCNLLSLIKLWRAADFRVWIDQHLWDRSLKSFWRRFTLCEHGVTVDGLCHKLGGLFSNPMGLAEIYSPNRLPFDEAMNGRMFLVDLSLPKGLRLSRSITLWRQFRVSSMALQFYLALRRKDLAESLMFVNQSSLINDQPEEPPNNWPTFEQVLRKYGHVQYKRRRDLLEAELACVLTPSALRGFKDAFGREFQLPPDMGTKLTALN